MTLEYWIIYEIRIVYIKHQEGRKHMCRAAIGMWCMKASKWIKDTSESNYTVQWFEVL